MDLSNNFSQKNQLVSFYQIYSPISIPQEKKINNEMKNNTILII